MAVTPDTTLHRLIRLAGESDGQAKSLLIDHACERLLKLTRKMFRSFPSLRRWEQTDDVFQNSLIRLHRALATVEVKSVSHFFNLAAIQIRRELLDLKKRHYGPLGGGTNHQTDHHSAYGKKGVLANWTREPQDPSAWAEFHDRVNALPDEHREIIDLLFYQALTQQEAAQAMGVSVRTLKRRWQAAKIQLGETLGEESG